MSLWQAGQFEAGLGTAEHWPGAWIAAGDPAVSGPVDLHCELEVDASDFQPGSHSARPVRMHLAAVGVVAVPVNSERLGPSVLDPGYADFHRNVVGIEDVPAVVELRWRAPL